MQRHNPSDKKEKEIRPPKKITKRYLTNAGLGYLKKFTASSGHFQKVMTRKIDRSCKWHVDQDKEECLKLLNEVTSYFQELGYLNDEAYSKALINSLARKGLSTRMMEQKLREKSISQELIRTRIETYKSEVDAQNSGLSVDQLNALQFIKRKKIGAYRSEKKEENKNRELSALARAGFSYNVANFALEIEQTEAENYLAASSSF